MVLGYENVDKEDRWCRWVQLVSGICVCVYVCIWFISL